MCVRENNNGKNKLAYSDVVSIFHDVNLILYTAHYMAVI